MIVKCQLELLLNVVTSELCSSVSVPEIIEGLKKDFLSMNCLDHPFSSSDTLAPE